MSRYIDADALHDALKAKQKWVVRCGDKHNEGYTYDQVHFAIDDAPTIDAAPSIDIQQWIPCVEEMPKEFVYVLICLKDGSMYVAQLTDYIDIWGNPKWCTNTKHCLGGAILGSEVIAWKPLPEPYGERREP